LLELKLDPSAGIPVSHSFEQKVLCSFDDPLLTTLVCRTLENFYMILNGEFRGYGLKAVADLGILEEYLLGGVAKNQAN
jgi:hypothetical protein